MPSPNLFRVYYHVKGEMFNKHVPLSIATTYVFVSQDCKLYNFNIDFCGQPIAPHTGRLSMYVTELMKSNSPRISKQYIVIVL